MFGGLLQKDVEDSSNEDSRSDGSDKVMSVQKRKNYRHKTDTDSSDQDSDRDEGKSIGKQIL